MTTLLAIAFSMDALGIGISYGVRGIRIPLSAKLIVAALSVAVTAVAVGIGSVFVQMLPVFVAKLTGALLLLWMGGWMLYQGLAPHKEQKERQQTENTLFEWMIKSMGITIKVIRNPYFCDLNQSSHLDPMEAVYLGIVLSIDSMVAGIGSVIAGVGLWLIPIMTGLFQFVFLLLGGWIGNKLQLCTQLDSRLWTVISGALLLVLAVVRLI